MQPDQFVRNNSEFSWILESAASAILVLDNDRHLSHYTAGSAGFFNLSAASIGLPLAALDKGSIDPSLLLGDMQMATGSGEAVEREIELGDKLFLMRTVVQDQRDDHQGAVISFVDISASLVAFRELRRLAAVLKDSTDAITMQLPDGCILAWNHGAEKMYGYSEAEALGMNIGVIVPDEERDNWQSLINKAYDRQKPANIEVDRIRKDGCRIEVSIAVTALVDQSGALYAVATTERDITLLREAEAQRRQTEIALEERLTMAGEMAAGLAHELNQPITSVVHYCDAALSIARDFDPKRRRELIGILEDATAQSHRAGEIIRNLRRFLGRRESTREPCSISEIIIEAIEFIRTECRQSQVDLELDLDASLPPVMVDQSQMIQVLVNLMKNSIEAFVGSKVGERRISISTHLDKNSSSKLQVTIRDTGPGIGVSPAEHVFKPFSSDKPSGLGMGLWISRSIVESHGGRLWADDQDSDGATFHFLLPTHAQELLPNE